MGKMFRVYLGVFFALCERSGAAPAVWVDAEAFANLGGWVIDQQSFAQVGSGYVMAHGLGVSVADATTSVMIPKAGGWHVWVRTRDWTAVWKRGTSGGRFALSVNGKALPAVLGTNGEKWSWQKAGEVRLEKGRAELALHDLTGFDGRCDAVCLTMDAKEPPPNELAALEAFRKKATGLARKDDATVYDFIVVGGGMAGTCAAYAAAQTGSRVLLVQDRGVLGGCNSSEVRVVMGGHAQMPPYPNVGKVVTAIAPIFAGWGHLKGEWFEDDRKADLFRLLKPGSCKICYYARAFAVEMDKADPKRIAAVIVRHARTGEEIRYRAKLFADCTGDAVIGRLAGASLMYGREARSEHQESLAPLTADRTVLGFSVQWNSVGVSAPASFPDIDWGLPFTDETCVYVRDGGWQWETGFNRDMADDTEYIRDYGLMSVLANWSYLKNHSPRRSEWSRQALHWVSPIGGKRESYRIVGDYIATQNDIEQHHVYPDATATLTWDFDHHFADPKNAKNFAEPFLSCAYHQGFKEAYPLPYRCLYSRDVKNLFMGGRSVSVTHSAFTAVRVMRTLGSLGEVVGLAATVCREKGCLPRDVYTTHFGVLRKLMEKGVTIREDHAYSVNEHQKYHFWEYGQVPANDAARKERFPAAVEKDCRERIHAVKAMIEGQAVKTVR